MHPGHYPQTRPRSRSASPVPVVSKSKEIEDPNEGPDNPNISSNTSMPENEGRVRSHSWRITARLQDSMDDPPDIIAENEPSEPFSERELLVVPHEQCTRPRSHSHHSERVMVEPASNGGLVSNYGSLNADDVGSAASNDEPPTPRPRSPRLKRQKSYYTPSMADALRKRNRLYFMDPITKLRYFHGFPWKLTLQLVKLVLITVQIIIFGGQREGIVEYFERSELAFKHLLLKDWEPGYETMPYPPATGTYAIYDKQALFEHIDNVVEQYYVLPEKSLAAMKLRRHTNNTTNTSMPLPVELCFRANLFEKVPNASSYVVSGKLLENCTDIQPYGNPDNYTFDVNRYLQEIGFDLPFNRTLDITLNLYVTTFHLNLLETHYGPTCYMVHITVEYENSQRSGQLLTTLKSVPTEIDCTDTIVYSKAKGELADRKTKNIAFDSCVIGICVLSTILCSRSLHRSNTLRADTATYFRLHRGKPFSFSNHMEFINVWYIIIICNDILTVTGSAFKIKLESRATSISSQNYELCSIFLGLGTFLTYVGILRYLGFFKSYNVLILTLKTSFPHAVRFLVCALCLYTGFLFCGWAVFSPYHIKFRKLSTASECLFSLVNGDDMFVTFSALTTQRAAIWYFHRAYLYVFISLFIYVVLSVFIAVIMDNYENLKYWYEKGFPDSEVEKFIREDGGMSKAELFSHVRKGHSCENWFFCIFPCLACFRRKPKKFQGIGERQHLLASI